MSVDGMSMLPMIAVMCLSIMLVDVEVTSVDPPRGSVRHLCMLENAVALCHVTRCRVVFHVICVETMSVSSSFFIL